MRLLHTSDWHLGQNFFGKTRQAEHAQLCRWLEQQVIELGIDIVIIAGDIFDTSTPPSYAREQYNQLIAALYKHNCQLVIVAGNHDSVAVLNESRQLLQHFNVQVLTQAQPESTQELVLIEQEGVAQAIICAIPFVRPRDVLLSQAGQSAEDKQQNLQQAIAQHYQYLFNQAQTLQKSLANPVPIIMTGHLTTVGASKTESVRDIYVGSLEAFPTNAFPAADYIALGHIHRPQIVSQTPNVRYSGSPIALSFDEANQHKQMWLLDFAQGVLSNIQSLAVPVWQPLFTVQGNLLQLEQKFKAIAEQLQAEQQAWLDVQVVDDDNYVDLTERVEALAENRAITILKVRRLRNAPAVWQQETTYSLAELNPEQVFATRLAQEQLTSEQLQQLTDLHGQALLAVQGEPV